MSNSNNSDNNGKPKGPPDLLDPNGNLPSIINPADLKKVETKYFLVVFTTRVKLLMTNNGLLDWAAIKPYVQQALLPDVVEADQNPSHIPQLFKLAKTCLCRAWSSYPQ
jgi:hypothetical protein